MRRIACSVVIAAWFLGASAANAEVQLTINDGRLTLRATDASLRQILAEWERVGQTKIFNADRVPGEHITVTLEDVPEDQALAILLRSISGYVAAPRAVRVANASRFDRIMVMPTIAPPRSRSMPEPEVESSDADAFVLPDVPDETPAPPAERPVRVVPPPASRSAIFNPYVAPQAEPQNAPQAEPAEEEDPQRATPARPTIPPGTSVPGMIPPAPPPDEQRRPD